MVMRALRRSLLHKHQRADDACQRVRADAHRSGIKAFLQSHRLLPGRGFSKSWTLLAVQAAAAETLMHGSYGKLIWRPLQPIGEQEYTDAITQSESCVAVIRVAHQTPIPLHTLWVQSKWHLSRHNPGLARCNPGRKNFLYVCQGRSCTDCRKVWC